MGSETSKPALGPDAPAQPNTITSRTPKPTPVKRVQLLDPLTPEMTPPRTYGLLTPPASALSKQPAVPEAAITYARPPTPPTSPSPNLPTVPTTPQTLDRATSQRSPPLTPRAHTIFTSTPCSHCHRPIPHPQRPRSQSPQPPPSPLECNHRLCKPCTRAALLASLSKDPFTPAVCPVCPGHPTDTSTGTDTDTNTDTNMECGTTTTTTSVTIPLALLGEAATAAEFLAYRDKLRERQTPPAQRLYCHDREGCGMFLSGEMAAARGWMRAVRDIDGGGEEGGPSRRVRVVVCPLCAGRTCTRCGGRAHRVGGDYKGVVCGGAGKGGIAERERMRRRRRKGRLRVGRRRDKGVGGQRVPLCPGHGNQL